MTYTQLVQQLREAGVTEKTLKAYLGGDSPSSLSDDMRQYLERIEAEKGRVSLEKSLDRWNTHF